MESMEPERKETNKFFSVIEHLYCISMSALLLVCCAKLWNYYKYDMLITQYSGIGDFNEPTSPVVDVETI